MTTLILDEYVEEKILAERRASGLDRFDEVWDGVYVMAPLANNEHQSVVSELTAVLMAVCGWELGAKVFAGCNVSDREFDWKSNYRCPDNAVYCKENPARNLRTHWLGGPDFAIEVTSDKDRSWEKLAFYASIQTRELLVIDRNPWKLSLLRLDGLQMTLVGTSTVDDSAAVTSQVIPLSFRLVPRSNLLPGIEVKHTVDGRTWLVNPD